MIIVITIFVFIIGFWIHSIKGKKFNNCKFGFLNKLLNILSSEKHNEYIVNAMLALLSVTLSIAVTYTDYQTKKQEKEQTIEFLENVLCPELNTKATFVTTAMIGMDVDSFINVKIEAEGISDDEISVEIEQPFAPEDMFETMKVYPINPIMSLDIVLNESPYRDTISGFTYSALNDCRMNFSAQKARVDNSDSIEEMVKHLLKMSYDFERAYKIIEIELKYQNNKISKDDVYKEIDELYKELEKNGDSIVIR